MLCLTNRTQSIYFLCELYTCSLQTESISTGHCFICLTSYNQILVLLLLIVGEITACSIIVKRFPLFYVLSRSITRAYYRNSVGGLLLFDITNRRSFQNVHDWLEEARSHVQPHSIVFLLVGHKCDLEAQRQVCTL